MTARRRPVAGRAIGAALAAAGSLTSASAQPSPAEPRAVLIARGATGPGGTAGTMTVRNVGRPCRIASFTAPEERTTTDRLDIVQPDVVAYTPRPGYTGPDEFH